MLNVFIIEQMNRKKKKDHTLQIPLYSEQPHQPPPVKKENKEERGVAIIDFTI
ncbi:MAG: hypothetical protein VX278_06195 [Myxococcota bacterium]|nr:hypothetical protein [Myxococcota bacterium]